MYFNIKFTVPIFLLIHSFVHSFHKHMLSSYSMPATYLSLEEGEENRGTLNLGTDLDP